MKIDAVKLAKRVKTWRAALLIEDLWRIETEVLSLDNEFPEADRGSCGTCDLDNGAYYDAIIKVCEENIPNEKTLEETIVHELLHVVLYPLELAAKAGNSNEGVNELILESTIERLSRAYVAIARRKSGL